MHVFLLLTPQGALDSRDKRDSNRAILQSLFLDPRREAPESRKHAKTTKRPLDEGRKNSENFETRVLRLPRPLQETRRGSAARLPEQAKLGVRRHSEGARAGQKARERLSLQA